MKIVTVEDALSELAQTATIIGHGGEWVDKFKAKKLVVRIWKAANRQGENAEMNLVGKLFFKKRK